MLERYTTRAKSMSMNALIYALADVNETLIIWRHEELTHPYVEKLYAEFDAYTVELHKRNKRGDIVQW